MIQHCRVCGTNAGGLVTEEQRHIAGVQFGWPELDLCPICINKSDTEDETLQAIIKRVRQEQSMTALAEIGKMGTTAQLTEKAMEKTGRLKQVVVSRHCLVALLRQGADGKFIKVDGLPEDAVVIGFSEHIRFNTDQIVLKVYSETFPALVEAEMIPELELWCSKYKEQKSQGREFI